MSIKSLRLQSEAQPLGKHIIQPLQLGVHQNHRVRSFSKSGMWDNFRKILIFNV